MDHAYLGWDWNPLILILLLAASIFFAHKMSNRGEDSYLVFWVLPALILFFGVEWGFPHDIWFKVIFWLLVAIPVLTAITPFVDAKASKLPLYYLLGIFLLILVLLGLSALDPDREWEWHDGRLLTQAVSDSVDSGPDLTPESVPTETETEVETESPSPSLSPTEAEEPSETESPSPSPTTTPTPSPQGNGDNEAREEIRYYDGRIPSIPSGTCPGLLGWDTLVECVEGHNLQWYIDGVNARANHTGFNWFDVRLWADARTEEGDFPEVRYVQVFGNRVSDDQAVNWAREQVGKDLRVVRQASCFDNTEGIPGGRLQDFYYCPLPERQMRISLMPLQLDEDGDAVGVINTQSGVFVDCLNVWWSREDSVVK